MLLRECLRKKFKGATARLIYRRAVSEYMSQILDYLFNRHLKDYLLGASCGYITGDRGTGKSTLFAMICELSVLNHYKVYSNYPIKGAFAIPTITTTRKDGSKRVRLDKEFLYSTDLSDSTILLDEARTIWNARAYSDWTIQDEDFFNMIRHYNTQVWLASQVYDGVDLNCRRAVEYTFFLQKCRSPFLKNFCSCDISRSVQVKVADRNTEIVMRGYARGAQKVMWDIGEIPCAFTYFYRKPYYGLFDSYHTDDTKIVREPVPWETLVNSV